MCSRERSVKVWSPTFESECGDLLRPGVHILLSESVDGTVGKRRQEGEPLALEPASSKAIC